MKTYKKSDFIKLNDADSEIGINKNYIICIKAKDDQCVVWIKDGKSPILVKQTYDEVFKMLINDSWHEVKSIHDIQSPGTSTIKYPDEV